MIFQKYVIYWKSMAIQHTHPVKRRRIRLQKENPWLQSQKMGRRTYPFMDKQIEATTDDTLGKEERELYRDVTFCMCMDNV
jgi:hypothetical protein